MVFGVCCLPACLPTRVVVYARYGVTGSVVVHENGARVPTRRRAPDSVHVLLLLLLVGRMMMQIGRIGHPRISMHSG